MSAAKRQLFMATMLLGLVSFVLPLHAKEAAPMISDPEIASRMAAMTLKLRCLVCQGQSVADSHSDFSNDIRREIQKLMSAGKTDAEVIDFLVQRYGDFILYEPPVKGVTMMLWFGPFILLIVAVIVLITVLKRRIRSREPELSAEDIARAEQLLSEDRSKGKTL